MTTKRQAQANRRNARQSPGPRTPEGEAVSALNALTRGFLFREALLLGEDEDALEELRVRLQAARAGHPSLAEAKAGRVMVGCQQ